MKRAIAILSILLCSLSWSANDPETAVVKTVRFSPNGGATAAAVAEIAAAKQTIRVQAYSFTSAPIADALIAAFNRGVDVVCVLDSSDATDKRAATARVADAGIEVFIDRKHAIAHNKLLLIDAKIVCTGSFNFTKNAEQNNAENFIVLQSEKLCAVYRENFEAHLKHSVRYLPPAPQPKEPK